MNQKFLSSGEPKIQFEGDSITLLATDDINTWFGPGYDVAINAYWGATTYENQTPVADDSALRPDVAVINLGTNDARTIVTGRSYIDAQGGRSSSIPSSR